MINGKREFIAINADLSVIGEQGSWWLFTASSSDVPQTWWDNGGAENLQATGDVPTTIDGNPVMRPTLLVWWIPTETLANQNVSPTIVSGSVEGDFPLIPPTSSSPSTEITVTKTNNGVIVTVPPQTGDTTIQITTSDL